MSRWPIGNPGKEILRETTAELLYQLDEDTMLPAVVRLEARRLASILETGAFTQGFWLAVDNTSPPSV